jgi:hypothetical protein
MHTEFWWGKLKAREHFGNLSIEGNNIKINLQEIREEVEGWNYVTLGRDK